MTGRPVSGLRILVIAKGFPPDHGGIETYSREVALAYARSGNAVHVLTSHLERPLPPAETGEFSWFRSVPQPSQLATARAMFTALLGLRLRGYRPDLVHATSWRVASFVRMIWPGCRLAITVHGKEVFTISANMRKLARAVLRMGNRLVFVSHAIREKFAATYPGFEVRSVVAWNGLTVYPDGPAAPPREAGALFTICRLVERKNIITAVRAVAVLKRRGVPFRYRIAGKGPESAAIAAEVQALDLGDSVEMLGFASDAQVAEEYARATVFLHPQIEADGGADIEGFGIAIADAMQFGAIPIAGDNGGPRDFIRNGENGYLVSGADAGEIADRIEALITEPDLAARLSTNARSFAQAHFSWAEHVATIIAACQTAR